MDEKTKRFELRRYFENFTAEKDLAREKYLSIGSSVITIFLLIWAFAIPSTIATFFSILTIEVTLYALTRFAYYLFIRPKLTEEKVDEILYADFERVSQYAEQKLNLQDPDGRPLEVLNTIIVYGLIVDETTKQPIDIPKKEKRDNKYHFAANRVIVFKFTAILVGVYICDLNSLDVPKTATIHEEIFECFLKDIDSFQVTIHNPFADFKLRVFSDSRLKEIFEILDSDTDEIGDIESDNIFNNMLNQISATEQEMEALRQLRQLKKLYGKKNFVLQEFLLQTVGGRVTSAKIGKLQNVDDSGLVIIDNIDDDVRAIQKLLRDRKKEGVDPNSPIYTKVDY